MGLPDAMTPFFPDQPTTSFCLYVNFEGLHDLVPESQVYALNAEGEIIAKQRVDGGKALFTLPVDDLQETTMLIGPPLRDSDPPTAKPHRRSTRYSLFNPVW
ncbi:MAG: hypothetical protein H6R26_918, partial [Proteobacteria bacterium]|nr:hypothetical protein [Pseudomonadota bacterium]